MSLPSFSLDPICVRDLDHEIKDDRRVIFTTGCECPPGPPKLFLPFSFYKCNIPVTWAAAMLKHQRPEPSLPWQSGFIVEL